MIMVLSCDQVPEINSDNYVVEAYLFSGQPVRDVTIKTLISLDDADGNSQPIPSAIVNVIKDDKTYPLIYNPGTKKYQYLDLDLEIEPLDMLSLEVTVNDRKSTSVTFVPTLPRGLQI